MNQFTLCCVTPSNVSLGVELKYNYKKDRATWLETSLWIGTSFS